MPRVDPPQTKTVMIPDENGVKRPWPIILRPEKMKKNPNIRMLMELGSDPDDDPGSDLDDNHTDSTTSMAQKAIYRSIWNGIKRGMNAVIPNASHGKLHWKDVTSAQRADIRAEVLADNPYLRRFEGGWLEELIMQRQLRNSRDTAKRNERKAKALWLKPLDHLAKKSRIQTKKKSMSSHRTQAAEPTVATQSNKDAPHSDRTASGQRKSSGRAGHSQQDQQSAASNDPDAVEKDPTSDRGSASPAPKAPNTNNKQNNLLAYFPKRVLPATSTANKRGLGAKGSSRCEEVPSDSSGSDDGEWSHGLDEELAKLRSKKNTNALHGSSSATTKGSTTPKPSTATARPKSRPKPRPPPGADVDEGLETELFRRTTRARKQEIIDEVEADMEAKTSKPPVKGKKNTRTKNGTK